MTTSGEPRGLGRPPLTWNALGRSREELAVMADWPQQATTDWAWGGSSGRGVRVCIVDSGIEGGHPDVGPIQGSYAVTSVGGAEPSVRPVDDGDACGHGTACAGIVRSLAPECELYSVRVLGERYASSGDAFVTGLRWAVSQGFDVVSLSLSTTRRRFAEALHAIADDAYFQRTLLVASAHNTPVESFPWRFSSVVSVGSHAVQDPALVLYNPNPPVEFFAHGTDVEVAWPGGGRTRITGNSFATPHVAGYCALALGKHPQLTPFQVKNLLYLTSSNVEGSA
ncbi:S8 family serine peptidase [Streptacidiphilus sp. P02-A3a]|uniref:S8 family peptidase n=1 Tax=Streptacidiphilus sp. P02-A3a TaxID=2704468 RepID=UPI0015FDD7CF|nr:S8 family serine peptidase [Streptacidiphilus sp. P02-A3a]QMU73256.1 S8 family serine peptidase [Streptacidiphilus sp. P02-A3a]